MSTRADRRVRAARDRSTQRGERGAKRAALVVLGRPEPSRGFAGAGQRSNPKHPFMGRAFYPNA
ncbi:MAG: hypothetical protein ACR2G6_13540, partial [Gemmatimonadaceae bacterium]